MNGTVEKRNGLWDLKSCSVSPEPEPSSERIKFQKYWQAPWPGEQGKERHFTAGLEVQLCNVGYKIMALVDIQPFIDTPSLSDDIITHFPAVRSRNVL